MSKTTETDTFRRLKAFMKDVDGDQRKIIKCLQDQVEYLLEKNRIYEEVAVEKNGGKQISLSDDQKKRLAVKGKRLNEFLLGSIEQTFAPSLLVKRRILRHAETPLVRVGVAAPWALA